MKIKEGYILKNVAKENIVVAVGEAATHFRGIMRLNDTGAFLWKNMENHTTTKALLDKLIREYEVDKSLAKEDIETFLKLLEEKGLLEQ